MPTISITVTAAQAARAAAALGKAQALKDNAVPPQPRNATAEEVRQFMIGRLRQLIIDVEGAEATKAAQAAIVIAPFDPQ